MGKFHHISDHFAANGGLCPHCKKQIRANGVGPDDFPALTSMLNKLPSSHILKYGANFHDIYYHLGTNVLKTGFISAKDAQRRADKIMFRKNQDHIKKTCKVWARPFYYSMNYRNYLFVKMFGHRFFGDKNCEDNSDQ